MDMTISQDDTATSAQLIVPTDTKELAFLVAGTADLPMVMDLLDLPPGSSIHIRVMLGEQVLQERVYEGARGSVVYNEAASVVFTSDDPTVAAMIDEMPQSPEVAYKAPPTESGSISAGEAPA
jgi:hypothetical protein